MSEADKSVVIFSADGHVGAKRMADYLPYFDPDIRDTVRDLLTDEEQAYRRMLAPDFTSRPKEDTSDGADRLWSPAAPERSPGLLALAYEIGLPQSRIGEVEAGEGLSLCDGDEPVALPDRLGWEHR